jgi:hypothetical protein
MTSLALLCQFFAIPDHDRPIQRGGHVRCGEAAARATPNDHGREALALLASLKASFACPVRPLSGHMAAPMIDLVAKI